MDDKQTDHTYITIKSRFIITTVSNSVNVFTFYRISTQRKSNLCFAHSQEEKFLITGKTHKGTRFYFLSNVITICSAEIKKCNAQFVTTVKMALSKAYRMSRY